MNEKLTTEQKDEIVSVLKTYDSDRKNLIPILQDIQAKLLYLPLDAMRKVAHFLNISGSTVFGVATFYNQFRLTPPGKHNVKVCLGTACHMKCGELIVEAWERELGIKMGEVTNDLEFDLERVACVGCCAMAPVTVIGETVHGKISPTKIKGIISGFQHEEEHEV